MTHSGTTRGGGGGGQQAKNGHISGKGQNARAREREQEARRNRTGKAKKNSRNQALSDFQLVLLAIRSKHPKHCLPTLVLAWQHPCLTVFKYSKWGGMPPIIPVLTEKKTIGILTDSPGVTLPPQVASRSDCGVMMYPRPFVQ